MSSENDCYNIGKLFSVSGFVSFFSPMLCFYDPKQHGDSHNPDIDQPADFSIISSPLLTNSRKYSTSSENTYLKDKIAIKKALDTAELYLGLQENFEFHIDWELKNSKDNISIYLSQMMEDGGMAIKCVFTLPCSLDQAFDILLDSESASLIYSNQDRCDVSLFSYFTYFSFLIFFIYY